MPLGEACLKLYERMPVAEANFFGIVISIQQRAGGNLSEALGNLSRVLRDRKKMKAKIKAMSMEAKASAAIIGALPIVGDGAGLHHEPGLHRAVVDGTARSHDAGRLRDLDVHRRVRDAQDDQFRLLRRGAMGFFIQQLLDPQVLTMVFAAIAAGATVLTLAMPLLVSDTLSKRMKAVALEREKIRQRERERLAQGSKITLRQSPKMYMKTVVENFNLSKWVGQEEARAMLVQAGYRGQAPYVTYLFFRMAMPVVMLVASLFYIFVVLQLDYPPLLKIAMSIGAAYFGMQSPNLFLKNKIQRRQLSIKRAFPDALDLLLICIESGMSIEAAFRKVSEEIGSQSVALAEEFTLTTAELSYLPDRRQAYENLAQRTGLEGVKAVCLALQQAERYGTPLGTTMRVLAQENRDMRMSEAEKKAAGLPPKLTVPMIVFFLPVLFVVILGPAAIRVMAVLH